MHHSHRGTIKTKETLDDITNRLRRDRKDVVTTGISGEVGQYWEALLLQKNFDSDKFQRLMEELNLDIW